MSKFKSHKGLLKRIKITGKGKVKFKGANHGHLRSHKTGNKLRQLRSPRTVSRGDIGRMERLLHRQLLPGDAD